MLRDGISLAGRFFLLPALSAINEAVCYEFEDKFSGCDDDYNQLYLCIRTGLHSNH